MSKVLRAGVIAAVAVAMAGCDATTAAKLAGATVTPTPASSSPTPTPTQPPTKTPTPTPTPPPPFTSSTTTVTAADLGKSWHEGCPVGPAGLRQITLTYWGFDNRAHTGKLVVAAQAVTAIREAFRRMYVERFPFREISPIAKYGGDDNASMAADNTSAFNCRYAVANGPKRWSEHAYGQAVDLDPRENPYTLDGRVYPPNGKAYTTRSDTRPGMVVPGSAPVRAFSAVGWGWGGRWSSSPDYQHFSATGQ